MNVRRWAGRSALIGLLLTVGCAAPVTPDGPPANQADEPNPLVALADAGAVPPDPGPTACDLATRNEVRQVTGIRLVAMRPGGNEAGISECAYELDAVNAVVLIALYAHDGAAVFERFVDSFPGGVPVPGVGDQAYWAPAPRALYVLVGERMLYVQLTGEAEERTHRTAARSLAQAALERLAADPSAGD